MGNKINSRLLNEAKKIEADYKVMRFDSKYSRESCAALMESMRLRNECQSDEDYARYVANFNARMVAALNRLNSNAIVSCRHSSE